MTKIFTNIGELIEILRTDFSKFSEDIWFRGQSDFDWKLTPGLMRLGDAPSEGALLTRFKQSAGMLNDGMTKRYKTKNSSLVHQFEANVSLLLEKMSNCFANNDILLRAQGAMVVYYLVFKRSFKSNTTINKSTILNFDQSVKDNRHSAETDYENAIYDLLEYDRLSQQGTNDASSIKERVRILTEYIQNTSNNA